MRLWDQLMRPRSSSDEKGRNGFLAPHTGRGGGGDLRPWWVRTHTMLLPDLERFAPYAVENGQEARLQREVIAEVRSISILPGMDGVSTNRRKCNMSVHT